MSDTGWILLAAAFAVVTGVNDGGSILSTGLKVPSVKPLSAVLILVGLTVAWPAVITVLAIGACAPFVGPTSPSREGPFPRNCRVMALKSAFRGPLSRQLRETVLSRPAAQLNPRACSSSSRASPM